MAVSQTMMRNLASYPILMMDSPTQVPVVTAVGGGGGGGGRRSLSLLLPSSSPVEWRTCRRLQYSCDPLTFRTRGPRLTYLTVSNS